MFHLTKQPFIHDWEKESNCKEHKTWNSNSNINAFGRLFDSKPFGDQKVMLSLKIENRTKIFSGAKIWLLMQVPSKFNSKFPNWFKQSIHCTDQLNPKVRIYEKHWACLPFKLEGSKTQNLNTFFTTYCSYFGWSFDISAMKSLLYSLLFSSKTKQTFRAAHRLLFCRKKETQRGIVYKRLHEVPVRNIGRSTKIMTFIPGNTRTRTFFAVLGIMLPLNTFRNVAARHWSNLKNVSRLLSKEAFKNEFPEVSWKLYHTVYSILRSNGYCLR